MPCIVREADLCTVWTAPGTPWQQDGTISQQVSAALTCAWAQRGTWSRYWPRSLA
jgi:hypothetical protein